MFLRNFIAKIQTLTNMTQNEILAVLFIFGSGLAGFGLKLLDANKLLISTDTYNSAIDSAMKVERSTFVSTDFQNNPNPALVSADTLKPKETFFPASGTSSKKSEFTGIVNINTASKVQLMKLPGIGEKTALAIIEYRSKQKFNSTEAIMNVKGIGPKKFEKIRNNITVQ